MTIKELKKECKKIENEVNYIIKQTKRKKLSRCKSVLRFIDTYCIEIALTAVIISWTAVLFILGYVITDLFF